MARRRKSKTKHVQPKQGTDPAIGSAGPGRPSKLNADVQRRLIEAILAGNHLEVACAFVGVDYTTVRDWVRRGEGRHPSREQTPEYTEFAIAITRAIAEAEVILVQRVTVAAAIDWRAATWILERRHPQRWANTQRVQLQVEQELEKTLDYLEGKLSPDVYAQVLTALTDAETSSAETETE